MNIEKLEDILNIREAGVPMGTSRELRIMPETTAKIGGEGF